jgi:ABC-type branched-subunit amino acid transport system ATPase component
MNCLAVDLSGVTKTFDSGLMALGPLDLAIRQGEFVSLVGPSGCGKSTAPRLIAGLSTPTSGRIAVSRRTGTERPGHAIGFVLAFRIAESGYRLNIPRMFAALLLLLLLSLAGIVIYALLALTSHLLLRRWHESALGKEN